LNKFTEENLKKSAERLSIRAEQIPRHIAIIMDGNGRWAEKKGLPRAQGHRQGGETVEKIALYCVDVGIECLTLYSFSMENWKRPKEEVDALMYIYTLYLVQIRPVLMKNNVNPLPVEVQRELFKTIEETSANTGMTLAIALNYGGRTEIIDATKKIAEEYKEGKIAIEDIDERCMDRHLYTAGLPEPDLLIRTANESRISNFLLWQISYSEFYVTKTLWPDFKKTDLDKAILAYAERDRRFGAVKPQTEIC
jgi:undecaprenyl diphosphate synthase